MVFGAILSGRPLTAKPDHCINTKNIAVVSVGSALISASFAAPAKAKSKSECTLELKPSYPRGSVRMDRNDMGIDWRLFFSSVRAV